MPESAEEVGLFLQRYGLERYFASIPGGLSALAGEGGLNLSGGQQKILALARALWQRPQLLLLDEPTSGLDRRAAAHVRQLLQAVKQETAIVSCTHQVLTARMADRVYILENGGFTASGPPQTLALGANLYSEMLNEYATAPTGPQP